MLTSSQISHVKNYIKSLNPSFLGIFLYYCLPIRKRTVLANMRQAFESALTQKEIQRLAKLFYSHMARFLIENIKIRFLSQAQIAELVEVEGYERLIDISQKQGKGIALLTGHFGNWEIAAMGGMLSFQAFRGRFHVIRKALKNKKLENILFRRFNQAGIQVIPKQYALDKACHALEKADAVVFIMDQHAAGKEGIWAPFFGKPAKTYRSLGIIAAHVDVKVVPMYCYRKPDNTHVLVFCPPLEWVESGSAKENLKVNTQLYNKKIEELVLMHPDQWLWFHKRWKSK